jgi:thymidylate synthase
MNSVTTPMTSHNTGQGTDQLAEVINTIKTNPNSRRIIMHGTLPSLATNPNSRRIIMHGTLPSLATNPNCRRIIMHGTLDILDETGGGVI